MCAHSCFALSRCSVLHDIPRSAPSFFFFNDTATTEIYTLSLHDALPICTCPDIASENCSSQSGNPAEHGRSEEHTSELQSQSNLVCRLLLEKKKKPRFRQPDPPQR